MTETELEVKQYRRRWVNLLLFIMYAINNGIHYVQYSVIISLIINYYKVPHECVELSTGLYALNYVIFALPGLYLLEKIDLRYIMIMVSILTTIASWIKVFTIVPDRFLLALVAQFMIAGSFTFTYGVSARLIASWFGVNESSRANALALLGDQLGGALSFIIPGFLIHAGSDVTVFENSLRNMHIMNASLSTVFMALIILLFKNQPKKPPSKAQAAKLKMEDETFAQSLKKMMKNRTFTMLLISYSINGSIMNAVSVLLGELVTMKFPKSEDAGKLGFLIMTVGMLTAPIWSYFLDKTGKYKVIANILFTGTLVSMVTFTISFLVDNIIYLYISSILMGIFIMSTYVNGIQIGIEIVYPLSEDKCSAIMVFAMQLSGLIAIPLYSALLKMYNDIVANTCFCFLALIALAISIITPIKLNRQAAEHNANAKELKEFLRQPRQNDV